MPPKAIISGVLQGFGVAFLLLSLAISMEVTELRLIGSSGWSAQRHYLFCAGTQLRPGTMEYFDGQITTDLNLADPKEYAKLKNAIGAKFVPSVSGEKVILFSVVPL